MLRWCNRSQSGVNVPCGPFWHDFLWQHPHTKHVLCEGSITEQILTDLMFVSSFFLEKNPSDAGATLSVQDVQRLRRCVHHMDLSLCKLDNCRNMFSLSPPDGNTVLTTIHSLISFSCVKMRFDIESSVTLELKILFSNACCFFENPVCKMIWKNFEWNGINVIKLILKRIQIIACGFQVTSYLRELSHIMTVCALTLDYHIWASRIVDSTLSMTLWYLKW